VKKDFNFIIFILSIFLLSSAPAFAIGDIINGAGVINKQNQDQLREQYIERHFIETTVDDIEKEKQRKEKEEQDKDLKLNEDLIYNPKFVLNSVNFLGNTVISDRQLHKLAKEYLGKEIYLDDLFDLTVKVSRFYQKKGYITSYAYLETQEIKDGNVTINICESKVVNKEVEGNKWERDAYLKHVALGNYGLGRNQVFNARALQGAMKDINNSGYMKGSVGISKDDDGNTNVKLNVQDRFPLRWDMAWDDFGRDYTGRQRWTNVLGVDNLTGFGDKIYGGVILAKDSKGVVAGYDIPVSNFGTRLSYDFSHSGIELGGPYRGYGIKGKANSHLIKLTQPILNNATQDLDFVIGFDFLNSSTDSRSFGIISDYSLRVLRTGFNGMFDDKYGRTLANLGFDFGFNGLGASGNIPGVAKSSFFKLNAALSRVQRLPKNCLGIVRVNGQYSPQPLYPTEQFYLGGAYSLRGYQASEVIGDYGIGGSVEVRTPIPGIKAIFPKKFEDDWARKVRFVVFYDWGYINSHNNNYIAATNFLHSVGFGSNINITDAISCQIGVGFPLLKKLGEDSARLYFTVNTELDKVLLKPKDRTHL
jgi:hemolysin activation/secretion protein